MKAPPSLLEAIELLQQATEANERAAAAVRRAAEDLQTVDVVNLELVISHCVKSLRWLKNADGVRGDRRVEAKGVYRMACAALSMEEAA